MAWTPPATWTVSELITASKMNSQIRDNLNYLKGAAGAFALDAMFTATAADSSSTRTGTLSTELIVANSNNSGGVRHAGIRFNASDTGAGTSVLPVSRVLGSFLNSTYNDSALILQTASAANTFRDVMTLRGANVGIGTTSPQGVLHCYDTISGFMKYEFDGLDGTARTLIPNGTGDVLYGVMPIWAVRASDGTTQGGAYSTGGTALVAPGGTLNIYSSGANIVQLQVAANGSVTVQRTGGALTYKVSLLLHWL